MTEKEPILEDQTREQNAEQPRIEPINPKQRELNERKTRNLADANMRMKIWRRMDEHVEQSIRARTGDTSVSDSVARLIEEEEENIALCEREMDETEASYSEARSSRRARRQSQYLSSRFSLARMAVVSRGYPLADSQERRAGSLCECGRRGRVKPG